ncbi:hypothetical protein [Helicobacter sp. T3_23-1056]
MGFWMYFVAREQERKRREQLERQRRAYQAEMARQEALRQEALRQEAANIARQEQNLAFLENNARAKKPEPTLLASQMALLNIYSLQNVLARDISRHTKAA